MSAPPHRLGSVCVFSLLLAAGGVGLGCSEPKPEPEIASSAPLASYAQAYPEAIDGAVASFGDAELTAKDLGSRYDQYPGELEGAEASHAAIADMLERAAEVGRSRAYYERLGEVEAVRRFYTEEKEDIRRKVAGAAQHTAQQAGCDAEVGGAAAVTLDKAIDEKTEERLRAGNDAQRLLERHRETLGKKNAAAVEKQIDEVALASYLVHIAMVEAKVRLGGLIEEAPRVRQTADELIEAEQAYQHESGRSDAQKKASSERIAAMKQAQSRMDAAVRNAESTLEGLPARIDRAQQAQRDALAKLLDRLRADAEGG